MATTSLTGTVVAREDKPRAKCRKWELRVNLPRSRDGRYPKRTRRFDGTWKAANAALRDFIAEVEREGECPDGSATFAEYADTWHGRRAASGALARRTTDREVQRIGNAKLHLGGVRLRDITARDVEDCYTAMLGGATLSGKPASPGYVEDVHRTLSGLFADAVRDGAIAANPARLAKRPKVPDRRRSVPSAAEVDAMLDAMDLSEPQCLAVAMCALCGLRRSEAVMVEWSDFDGRELTVDKAAEDDGTPKPTKNVGVRYVPVPRRLRAALSAGGSGAICPVQPNALYKWWSRNRARWGMDGYSLHDLRHAYATRLAEAGVHPRVMMQLGGWRSIDVCMKIYTHVNSGALHDAVEAAFGRDS